MDKYLHRLDDVLTPIKVYSVSKEIWGAMQKRFLTGLVIMMFTALAAIGAQSNYLNAVVLDGNNVILRSDYQAKIKKIADSDNKITLILKNTTASDNLSTLYKGTSEANIITAENGNNNELRLHIQSPGISKANVVFETPDSAPVTVIRNDGLKNVSIAVLILAFFLIAAKSARAQRRFGTNLNYKDREVELYKNFKPASINYKVAKEPVRRAGRHETIRNYAQIRG